MQHLTGTPGQTFGGSEEGGLLGSSFSMQSPPCHEDFHNPFLSYYPFPQNFSASYRKTHRKAVLKSSQDRALSFLPGLYLLPHLFSTPDLPRGKKCRLCTENLQCAKVGCPQHWEIPTGNCKCFTKLTDAPIPAHFPPGLLPKGDVLKKGWR